MKSSSLQELYSHHGVLVNSQSQNRDDDSQCSGTLSIVEYVSIILIQSVIEIITQRQISLLPCAFIVVNVTC